VSQRGGTSSPHAASEFGARTPSAGARDPSPWRQDLPALAAMFGLAGAYLVSFLLLYVVVRQVAPSPIIYYSSIGTLLLAAAVNVAATLVVGRFRRWSVRPVVLVPALATFVLTGYAFVITIPSLLDRSISHFLIGTLAEVGPEGADLDAIQRVFVERYVEGTTAIEKRLHEQVVSGNIAQDGRHYRVTPRGLSVYRTTLLLARLFNITDHYLSPLRRTSGG
jgi:hypothetical protein